LSNEHAQAQAARLNFGPALAVMPQPATAQQVSLGSWLGMKQALSRRSVTMSLVILSSLNRKWRRGSSEGELMTGLLMTT
jgi:hypothetical protein